MAKKADGQILIVDDDRATRRVLVRTLCSAGYDCAEAETGDEALELVRREQPSLLLLDFEMPGLNGAEVLKKLRADADSDVANVPAIMLTGHTDEQSEVLCLDAGANDFVTKPINTAVLRARIETQLRLRSMREQLQQQNEELEQWRRNLERDLAAARLTQQSLIPQKRPPLSGWDIADYYRPVIQVGGDIYGWLTLKDARTLFWIVDATGHGASAALLTTLAKLLFHHGSIEHGAPDALMRAVNEDFRSIFGARSFMTAMCVALEAGSGRASVVGAGHPPLLIARQGASAEAVSSHAPPLGVAQPTQFSETVIDLRPGDAFILYTDGLFGGRARVARRLTPQRLIEKLNGSASDAQTLLEQLLRYSPKSDDDQQLLDDVTAVVVRREVKK
ncbi:MAG TPA: SpoIIE family protein phosphatase [Chthoniobacterales bacterium]|nr:SpoIIE family protein phosphatase [Chthoniobacterales bacterium]